MTPSAKTRKKELGGSGFNHFMALCSLQCFSVSLICPIGLGAVNECRCNSIDISLNLHNGHVLPIKCDSRHLCTRPTYCNIHWKLSLTCIDSFLTAKVGCIALKLIRILFQCVIFIFFHQADRGLIYIDSVGTLGQNARSLSLATTPFRNAALFFYHVAAFENGNCFYWLSTCVCSL